MSAKKRAKPVKLPDKPSALIRLALRDLEKAERSRNYKVAMHEWHRPNGKCTVCFAGSVMAFSLGVDRHVRASPRGFDADTTRKLYALNDFRSGLIDSGLAEMGYSLPEGVPDFDERLPMYAGDPVAFKTGMRRMATLLAKHGC